MDRPPMSIEGRDMPDASLGRQYAGDDAFKARARLHQSRFRVRDLGLAAYRDYGNRLAPVDAAAGKNFFDCPEVLEAVRGRGLGDTVLCRDMLRSEHIPFNLFVPMRDQSWAAALVSGWVGRPVARVVRIDIGWAPRPKSAYLDDHTSFDTYLEYVEPDGTCGGVGIEVKYTEGEYPWGKHERARSFAEDSAYLRVHDTAQLYVDDALVHLRTKRLKQLWRNHLLGEAILLHDPHVERFTSVLMYPAGNVHYAAAAPEYQALLRPERQGSFAAVTFEQFVAQARRLAKSEESGRWLNYLQRRYLPE
jgi:hypothetical protein